jgi:peptide/nickel transport system substrate-binding protein
MATARTGWAAALLLMTTAWAGGGAIAAEAPKDTLVIVSEDGPNGLDTMVPTANDYSRMVVWQAYDRLVSHGEKTLPDGTVSYDAKVLTPELAESWEISEDKKP